MPRYKPPRCVEALSALPPARRHSAVATTPRTLVTCAHSFPTTLNTYLRAASARQAAKRLQFKRDEKKQSHLDKPNPRLFERNDEAFPLRTGPSCCPLRCRYGPVGRLPQHENYCRAWTGHRPVATRSLKSRLDHCNQYRHNFGRSYLQNMSPAECHLPPRRRGASPSPLLPTLLIYFWCSLIRPSACRQRSYATSRCARLKSPRENFP